MAEKLLLKCVVCMEQKGTRATHTQFTHYVFACLVAWLLRGQECSVGPGEGVGHSLVYGLACKLEVRGGRGRGYKS